MKIVIPERISPYIQKLITQTGGKKGPIGRQFLSQRKDNSTYSSLNNNDPLEEDAHECAPRLIYKHKGKIDHQGNIIIPGRALWLISKFCATPCQFCTRGRFIGKKNIPKDINTTSPSTHKKNTIENKEYKQPHLSSQEIQKAIDFIHSQKEIREVILSGGDPLVLPQEHILFIIKKLITLQKQNDIDIIRIHTRAPVTNPLLIKNWHYDEIFKKIHIPRISLHVNHPAEITPEFTNIVTQMRDAGAVLYAQSVLLKGVNDSVETLHELFYSLMKIGVHPYYLYQNDPVPWAQDFTVPLDKAIKLWQQVRPRLPGIAATARFVIDTPQGKMPVFDIPIVSKFSPLTAG